VSCSRSRSAFASRRWEIVGERIRIYITVRSRIRLLRWRWRECAGLWWVIPKPIDVTRLCSTSIFVNLCEVRTWNERGWSLTSWGNLVSTRGDNGWLGSNMNREAERVEGICDGDDLHHPIYTRISIKQSFLTNSHGFFYAVGFVRTHAMYFCLGMFAGCEYLLSKISSGKILLRHVLGLSVDGKY